MLEGNQQPEQEAGRLEGQGSQPSGGTQAQKPSEPQAQPTPSYVTREDLNQSFSDLEKRISSMLQSNRARTANRVQELLEERETRLLEEVNRLRNSGVDVTEDEIKAAKTQIRSEILAKTSAQSPDQPSQADGRGRGQAPTPEELRNASLEAQKISLKYGFLIEPNDPEFEQYAKPKQSREAMLEAVEAAHRAKATRLGLNVPSQSSEAEQRKAPAERSPGFGSGGSPPGNPIQDIDDPDLLFKEWKKSRRG